MAIYNLGDCEEYSFTVTLPCNQGQRLIKQAKFTVRPGVCAPVTEWAGQVTRISVWIRNNFRPSLWAKKQGGKRLDSQPVFSSVSPALPSVTLDVGASALRRAHRSLMPEIGQVVFLRVPRKTYEDISFLHLNDLIYPYNFYLKIG